MKYRDLATIISKDFACVGYWNEPRYRQIGEFSTPNAHGVVWDRQMFESSIGGVFADVYSFDRLPDTEAVEDRLDGALGRVLNGILDLPVEWIPWTRDGYGPTFTALAIATAESAAVTLEYESKLEYKDPVMQAYYWLLQALPTVLPPTCARRVIGEKAYVDRETDTSIFEPPPAWLGTPPNPTGRVWRGADDHGDHLAVYIETRDPTHGTEKVYMVGCSAAGGNYVETAGQYPSLAEAIAAWESWTKPARRRDPPAEVDSGEQLAFLAYLHEPPFAERKSCRAMTREYFRCQRRLSDAVTVLAENGIKVPPRARDNGEADASRA